MLTRSDLLAGAAATVSARVARGFPARHPLFGSRSPAGCHHSAATAFRLGLLYVLFVTAVLGQFYRPQGEPQREWLPLAMTYPTKITADRLENAERPAITRDAAGAVWIVWSSCRPETERWPIEDPSINAWMWPDDGQDSIYVRRFDGADWSEEQRVSQVPGVNHRPAIIPDGKGVRVLWTARRGGRWAAYERRFDGRSWAAERRIPGTEDALEIRSESLGDGRALAVIRTLAPPRIELQALTLSGGSWSDPQRVDEGLGRCHRPHLLALEGSGWRVAWDEERDGNYDIYSRGRDGPVERLTTSTLWGYRSGSGGRRKRPHLGGLGPPGARWRTVLLSWPQHLRESAGSGSLELGAFALREFSRPGQAHAALTVLGRPRHERRALPPVIGA